MLFSKTSPLELFCSSSVSEVALNAAARSSCFNVRVIKKLNYVPVVEDGLNEKGLFYNDERRMKETVRHMRKILNT